MSCASQRKRRSPLPGRHPDAWVLGADTIVIIAGEVLGKPGSTAEAREMLEKLSGREHEVFTGFSIVRQKTGNPDP